MSRAEPDPIALWISGIVQHHLITSPERPGLPPMPEGVVSVEAHPIGLDTGVAVTTADRVRYFLVRVAEFDHR